jgi:hypothetical protein
MLGERRRVRSSKRIVVRCDMMKCIGLLDRHGHQLQEKTIEKRLAIPRVERVNYRAQGRG